MENSSKMIIECNKKSINSTLIRKKTGTEDVFCQKKTKFVLTFLSKCDYHGNVKERGETVNTSKFRRGMIEKQLRFSASHSRSSFQNCKETS